MFDNNMCRRFAPFPEMRVLLTFQAILSALFFFCGSSAHADIHTIKLTRSFDRGAAEAFQQALTNDIDTVLLDVSGGYLSEGIAIGRIIRSRNMRVIIPQDAVCYSACAEAFLGGTRTQINGVLAFHVPRVEGARSKKQAFRFGLAGGTATAIYRFEMGFGFALTRDINQWTNETTMLAFRSVDELNGYRHENRVQRLPNLISYRP